MRVGKTYATMSQYFRDPIKAKLSTIERRQAIEQALKAGTSTTLIAARFGATDREIKTIVKAMRQASGTT